MMYFINNGTKNKESILLLPQKQGNIFDHINIFSSTLIESLTNEVKIKYQKDYCPWILFLPILFLFEIVLDLFHYTFHRALHCKHLYFIHKQHHYYTNPVIINTFYHNPLDLIITVSIPTLIAFYILPFKFTDFQKHLILTYKVFIELSGHTGKQINASSFPLCIWLPKFFGIELYTKDHHKHHSQANCNFSKRFTIWDKIFKTYK